jgi:hypothetical protein
MSVDRNNSAQQLPRNPHAARILNGFLLAIAFLLQGTGPVGAQSAASNKWTVTIVLPAKVVAGRPATLAVLGVDGRLASDVTLDLGGGQHVVTDATGRASFIAPSAGSVLIAKGSGSSTAALLDANPPENPTDAIWAAAVASLHEPFSICGSRFRSDADANHVRLNGEPALVMASSPECLSVMPGPKAAAGPAAISVQTASGQWTAHTTLVSLEPQFPSPALLPGQKGRLSVNARGTDEPLRIAVANETPGILRFLKGDVRELVTSGGKENCASLEVEAIRSGDFSLDARLLPSPDVNAARRYLEAAAPLAEKADEQEIDRLARVLGRNPRNLEGPRRDLDKIIIRIIEGDLRTILAAARAKL